MSDKKQKPTGNGADKAAETVRAWIIQHKQPFVPKRPAKPSHKDEYTCYD